MRKRQLVAMAALTLALVAACSDSNGARRVLENQGYTNVKITGWAMFGCGDGDAFSTGFEASSRSGAPIKGVVCKGWIKGATVREK